VLRGTARIGLKALFPIQGPHAAYPHSYMYMPELHLAFSWDSDTSYRVPALI